MGVNDDFSRRLSTREIKTIFGQQKQPRLIKLLQQWYPKRWQERFRHTWGSKFSLPLFYPPSPPLLTPLSSLPPFHSYIGKLACLNNKLLRLFDLTYTKIIGLHSIYNLTWSQTEYTVNYGCYFASCFSQKKTFSEKHLSAGAIVLIRKKLISWHLWQRTWKTKRVFKLFK